MHTVPHKSVFNVFLEANWQQQSEWKCCQTHCWWFSTLVATANRRDHSRFEAWQYDSLCCRWHAFSLIPMIVLTSRTLVCCDREVLWLNCKWKLCHESQVPLHQHLCSNHEFSLWNCFLQICEQTILQFLFPIFTKKKKKRIF